MVDQVHENYIFNHFLLTRFGPINYGPPSCQPLPPTKRGYQSYRRNFRTIHGPRPDPRPEGQELFFNITCPVGSRRVGPRRVRRFSTYHGSGRVGSGRVGSAWVNVIPGPTRLDPRGSTRPCESSWQYRVICFVCVRPCCRHAACQGSLVVSPPATHGPRRDLGVNLCCQWINARQIVKYRSEYAAKYFIKKNTTEDRSIFSFC